MSPAPHPDYDPYEEPNFDRRTATVLHTLTTEQVKAMPPPDWLVQDLLVLASKAWLVGRWGLGKSFWGVDLGLSVAAGIDFHGLPTTSGNVVYVVGEGVAGMGRRIDAWEQHHGVTATRTICTGCLVP